MRHTLTLILAAALTSPALADIRLPVVISDHAVLQQNSDVPIWGWAAPGEKVTVKSDWGADASATADAQGSWRTKLKTGPASDKPHTITIAGKNTINLTDILFGEVWVCSGQSNMEWQLHQSDGGAEEGKAANHPTIRLFNVPNVVSSKPESDCKAAWQLCSPQTAPNFSAIGYLFAKDIQESLNIPIGMIETDWGGTPAEAWTSAEGLAPLKDFDDQIQFVHSFAADPAKIAAQQATAAAAWYKSIGEADPGTRDKWFTTDLDDSKWDTMAVPGAWDREYANFDGFGWYRRTVDIPATWKGDATLELGGIDDCDTTWVNGTQVGEYMTGPWETPRIYPVPASVLKTGKNTIAIRVLDTGGPGGLMSKPEAIRLKPATPTSGDSIPLAGQWKFKTGGALAALPKRPAFSQPGPNHPTTLYNGMIAPIQTYGIRGAIWYQGESNVGRAFQYRTLFPAMISDWRRVWGEGDFPFYFVQIAPFGYGGDKGEAAELREAQMLTLKLPNTGMAVTMDIGNPGDIHPKNKIDVGRRLSLWALARTYGKLDYAYSGPTYESMKVEGSTIRLTFLHSNGLTSGDKPPTCFTIAGADRKFVPAEAKIDGETIIVSAASIATPVAVRFAWGAADQPNLKNKAGLPASSFRTDDWPGITEPAPKH